MMDWDVVLDDESLQTAAIPENTCDNIHMHCFLSFQQFQERYQNFIELPTPNTVVHSYATNKTLYGSQMKGEGANYLITHAMTKGKKGRELISDQDTLFLLLLTKVTKSMSRPESGVVLSLLQYASEHPATKIPVFYNS